VLLSQSVLLRGINDSAETLAELCLALVEIGVLPYYLHQLDRVCGAAHFEVNEKEGAAIIDKLRCLVPGYAVPRYVRELAGAGCKVAL
jgi:L-lysine 2,3-aminomutase